MTFHLYGSDISNIRIKPYFSKMFSNANNMCRGSKFFLAFSDSPNTRYERRYPWLWRLWTVKDVSNAALTLPEMVSSGMQDKKKFPTF